MIDEPGVWAKACLIHQSCGLKLQPVKRCEPGQAARDWSTLGGDANALDGTRVALSGIADLDDSYFSTMVACTPRTCCNGVTQSVVLGEPPHALALDGLVCRGDESRLCCNVVARGQPVIASGKLHHIGLDWWELEDVSLCEVGD